MSDARPIGLPSQEETLREPTSADMWKARGVNLFGLVSPASNLGMVFWSPAEIRWFGVGAGVIFALGIAYGSFADAPKIAIAAAILHYGFVLLGLLHPKLPELPARAWMAFGKAMGHFMSYPIFALLYYLAVTPTALLVRLLGKDPLGLRTPTADSYWVSKDPIDLERYKRQF